MNTKPNKFSPEVRERAVRLVREQRNEHPSLWAAVESIAGMIGCTPQTRHEWVKRDQIDQGERAGVTTDERRSGTGYMTTTRQDREKRVKRTLANSALEGWQLDSEFIALLDRYIAGEISLESVIEYTKAQYKQVPDTVRTTSE